MNGFVDLDKDTLFEVFKRVDVKTLLRAACVNKLWYTTAQNEQLWAPICLRLLAGMGRNWEIDFLMPLFAVPGFSKMYSLHLTPFSKPPPTDFYSIDPEVFSKQIRPWVSPYRGSNELWYTTAQNEQLWPPICSRLLAGMGVNREIDFLMPFSAVPGFSFSEPPTNGFLFDRSGGILEADKTLGFHTEDTTSSRG